jgi:hypothetical protein
MDLKNRLFEVLDELDKIQKENLLSNKKNRKVKKKSDGKSDVIENQATNLVNTPSNYFISQDIIMTSSPFHLPEIPIPQKVLRIINLGASGLKVIANENETIFHTFYAPNGSPHLIIPENSWVDVLFIEKPGGEKIWLSK